MCFVLVIFLMYTLNSFHTLVSYASTQFLWDSLRNSLLSEILFKFMHDSQQLDWCPEVADQRDWYKFSINQLDSEEY